MSHSAFFYGTLMAPAVLHRVIHGTPTPEPWQRDLLTITPALLPGHVRHRVANADYPAVMPASGSTPSSTAASVRGTFVTGLTDGDIWRLDIFEGDEYARRDVRVRLLSGEEEGEEKVAQTYIWIAGEERLEKEEWDFDEFVREKMGRWVGGVELAGKSSFLRMRVTFFKRGRADGWQMLMMRLRRVGEIRLGAGARTEISQRRWSSRTSRMNDLQMRCSRFGKSYHFT